MGTDTRVCGQVGVLRAEHTLRTPAGVEGFGAANTAGLTKGHIRCRGTPSGSLDIYAQNMKEQSPNPKAADGTAAEPKLKAEPEAAHRPIPTRILAELHSGIDQAEDVGAKSAKELGGATKALHLEVVETPLQGSRALVGHVLGMRLLIPAEGIHGPRETTALLYLFGDAIAIRPTDDAPMSAVPVFGLHIILPHVALARWAYKAGRTVHANLDLERDQQAVEESLASWTADDFHSADPKLQVYPLTSVVDEVHVYQHLGLAWIAFQPSGRPLVRMKSALPESAKAYLRLYELFAKVLDQRILSMGPLEGDSAKS